MRDELLEYYEKELTFLRRLGAEFADRYPKVASRLQLEPTKCDDPHVERLLEGFAFLAARVHLKLDDDFPDVTEALLSVVYPHYTRPLPSLSMVEFELDPDQGKLTNGYAVPRGTALFSDPVGGDRVRFRTCYDTVLWPLSVSGVSWGHPSDLRPAVRAPEAVAALRVGLTSYSEVGLPQLDLETLRFYLSADPHVTAALYELLCNNCYQVLIRDPDGRADPIVLPGDSVRPVGFGEDETLLPPTRRSFHGYSLLLDYFALPEKYYFVDVTGLDRLRHSNLGERAELIFLIRSFEAADRGAQLEHAIGDESIRLGCTPVVNLFPAVSDPIQLHHRRQEYLIIPDIKRRSTVEVFSIDGVKADSPGSAEPLRFDPLYSFRHGDVNGRNRMFWQSKRRPAKWRADEGTDVYLSFADLSGRRVHPDAESVTVDLTCTNGDLPRRLPFRNPTGDFQARLSGAPIRRIMALTKPTASQQPTVGAAQLWHLVSQLSLNYLSLVDGGVERLRELLRLSDYADSPAGRKQIGGITAVSAAPEFARIESPNGLTFTRGHHVEIEFDESQFAGGSVYLLASVLERFFGLYVSMNSFSRLTARSSTRREPIRVWAARSGRKPLL